MDVNIGIDDKSRTRQGRRDFSDRLITLANDRNDDINDYTDSNLSLNVRVKERRNGGTRKGAVGSILKDTPATAIKNLFRKDSTQDLKDTFKRPITGLFQRPSSRASPKFTKGENEAGTDSSSVEPLNYGNEHMSQSSEQHCLEEVLYDVANAPNVNINQKMYQIGFMSAMNTSLAKLDDIDLSLLLRFLCLEGEVDDEKVSWTWDYLFTSVNTDMRNEWKQSEERGDGDYEMKI
ncbi:unnamed protein product [Litomosoides sigmodontis]|uniref:Intraflagellar transport protein 43 homolog n=1 Tax=Litomosoides sigmodontis TaxID=42156 RepID=A0A3P6SLQ5_LITSI|nr:unnamed protein product [Litomosoides sigmodontis]